MGFDIHKPNIKTNRENYLQIKTLIRITVFIGYIQMTVL